MKINNSSLILSTCNQEYDQLKRGLQELVDFFNHVRIHQGLDYQTPDKVYEQGTYPNIKEKKVGSFTISDKSTETDLTCLLAYILAHTATNK